MVDISQSISCCRNIIELWSKVITPMPYVSLSFKEGNIFCMKLYPKGNITGHNHRWLEMFLYDDVIMWTFQPQKSPQSTKSTKWHMQSSFCQTLPNFGRSCFAYATPSLWNPLPTPVKRASSIDTFKSSLKTYLFNVAYPSIHWLLYCMRILFVTLSVFSTYKCFLARLLLTIVEIGTI